MSLGSRAQGKLGKLFEIRFRRTEIILVGVSGLHTQTNHRLVDFGTEC